MAQAISLYAPLVENDAEVYIAHVARVTGLDPNLVMGTLTPDQIVTVANAIVLMEGYRAGTIN